MMMSTKKKSFALDFLIWYFLQHEGLLHNIRPVTYLLITGKNDWKHGFDFEIAGTGHCGVIIDILGLDDRVETFILKYWLEKKLLLRLSRDGKVNDGL